MQPIVIVKNGVVFPIEARKTMQAPFSFRINEARIGVQNEFKINEGESPIYFVRKRIHVQAKGQSKTYIYKFCVGVRHADNSVEKHWINVDGSYDSVNNEPEKVKVI